MSDETELGVLRDALKAQGELIAMLETKMQSLEEKSLNGFMSAAALMTQMKQRIETLEAHQRHFFNQTPGAGIGQAIPIIRAK